MNNGLEDRINRARELLRTVQHAAMATVNEDGSPHNTPYFFMYGEDLSRLYWGSHPEAQHSKNIQRTGQIFVVLFEAKAGGGLFIRADQAKELEGDELKQALNAHNNARAKIGKEPLSLSYYGSDSPQRMYSAVPINFWVNMAERDQNSRVLRDYRQEISREDLLGINNEKL
jgi:hypothetical protein